MQWWAWRTLILISVVTGEEFVDCWRSAQLKTRPCAFDRMDWIEFWPSQEHFAKDKHGLAIYCQFVMFSFYFENQFWVHSFHIEVKYVLTFFPFFLYMFKLRLVVQYNLYKIKKKITRIYIWYMLTWPQIHKTHFFTLTVFKFFR
jgi:hypothetical protein